MKKYLIAFSLLTAFISYTHSAVACPEGCDPDIFGGCTNCNPNGLSTLDGSKIDLGALKEGEKIEVVTKEKGEHITVQKQGDKLIWVK